MLMFIVQLGHIFDPNMANHSHTRSLGQQCSCRNVSFKCFGHNQFLVFFITWYLNRPTHGMHLPIMVRHGPLQSRCPSQQIGAYCILPDCLPACCRDANLKCFGQNEIRAARGQISTCINHIHHYSQTLSAERRWGLFILFLHFFCIFQLWLFSLSIVDIYKIYWYFFLVIFLREFKGASGSWELCPSGRSVCARLELKPMVMRAPGGFLQSSPNRAPSS